MRKRFLSLMLIVCAATLVRADYVPEPYSDALEEKARGGDAKAMYDVLHHIVYDVIVISDELDNATLYKYLTQSAAQNYPEALVMLGDYYYYGQLYDASHGYVVISMAEDPDVKKAEEQYKKAALLNHTGGMNSLGLLYLDGDGEMRDYKKALEWFTKSAELGDSDALVYLSYMNYYGKGVPVDYLKSKDYDTKAAALGNVLAMTNLGELYLYGTEEDARRIEDKPKAQIAPDLDKAIEWYTKAAEKEDLPSMRLLVTLYMNKSLGKLDYVKARKWLEQLVENNDIGAAHYLGVIYEEGLGGKERP